MPRSNGRKKIVVLGAACALLAATGAYAFWTAGGSGSGSGEAGTTTALIVNQVTVLDDMYPGDSAQEINGTFDNDNAGPIRVATVTAAISSVVKAGNAPAGACTAADFTLDGAVMTVGTEIATGDAVGDWGGATIQFNNTGASQDGCKGATVTLSYTIA